MVSQSAEEALIGPRLKLTRAEAQAKQLDESIVRYLIDSHEVIQQRNNETGEDCAIFRSKHAPPDTWAIDIGEILHNLRSALDHIIYRYSRLDSKGVVPSGTEFPVFIDEPRYLSTKKGGGLYKIRGLDAAARAIVDRVQPHTIGDDARIHKLWILQELSNVDKHRLLHYTTSLYGLDRLNFSVAGARVEIVRRRPDGPVEDGAELAAFRLVEMTAQQAHVQMQAGIGSNIVFDQALSGLQNVAISTGIRWLGELVAAIINEFAKVSPPPR